ncbi:hypothetical protein [Methylobacterium brachiatum]|jgi:hypothetical protein|uniref:Uncharacterized protein n=1 Tax=Methylobacterium brachiatum TaxID=269660 RepID=A0AAJ1WXF2_9HYPH|nr:hypothetical protein [Methylobacterium brachiatum]AYO81841.1 hypothetical protein EBB05_05900 [Methylobacterium brachiatum]MCB4804338.1 hypothetical protein [Methylobacterium brachiatum]MDH2314047.1 hypothetical protein [Methylobacterium brachiatum]MDQ0545367.1 hypothetical protein [Methylobacterium brachiatum]
MLHSINSKLSIAQAAVTLSLVLSITAPLLTGVAALLWAGFVAPSLEELPETAAPRDLRTW